MEISKLKITGTTLDKLVNHLLETSVFKYKNLADDMTVLATENFYFRNNSTQLNMIVIKKEDDILHVDLIGAAGGSGLFNFNFGSEKGFIKSTKKIINEFCSERGLQVEIAE
jgi:hypothetical protein